MNNLLSIANKVLEESKKYNCDFAFCSVKERETKEFNSETGEFTLFRTLFDKSVSISIVKDKRRGSVAINGFEEEKILKAVEDAYLAAEGSEPDDAWEIDSSGIHKKFSDGPLVPDTDKLFMRTKELIETVKAEYPKLFVEQTISAHTIVRSVYMNSYGTTYEDVNAAYDFMISFAGHEGENSSHTYYSAGRSFDLDKPFIDYNTVRRELKSTEKQANPKPLEDKFTGTVVFTPDCAADVVVGTILGNFVSDSSLIEDTSIWKDKIGEVVSDSRLSIRLAPSDDRVLLGQKYTGEGYLAEDYDVIKDGVLKSFCLSQYGANKLGMKRSPNTSHALIVPAGDKSLDEIISEIDKGILIGRFSGGSPGANGEFSGVAKNAFLIEDGKLTKALSETMISDNLPEMLFRLRALSKDVKEAGGGSVPYMAFDGLTISGK